MDRTEIERELRRGSPLEGSYEPGPTTRASKRKYSATARPSPGWIGLAGVLLVAGAVVLRQLPLSAPVPPASSASGASAAAKTDSDINGQATALLESYGWHPSGVPERKQLVVGQTTEPPWTFYERASRKIGFELGAHVGTAADFVMFRIGTTSSGASVRGVVAFDGAKVIGAWISVDDSAPGVFPFDAASGEVLSAP